MGKESQPGSISCTYLFLLQILLFSFFSSNCLVIRERETNRDGERERKRERKRVTWWFPSTCLPHVAEHERSTVCCKTSPLPASCGHGVEDWRTALHALQVGDMALRTGGLHSTPHTSHTRHWRSFLRHLPALHSQNSSMGRVEESVLRHLHTLHVAPRPSQGPPAPPSCLMSVQGEIKLWS